MELNENEWRTIHNALAVYQCSSFTGDHAQRKSIQQLMDKIRDNFIARDETLSLPK